MNLQKMDETKCWGCYNAFLFNTTDESLKIILILEHATADRMIDLFLHIKSSQNKPKQWCIKEINTLK